MASKTAATAHLLARWEEAASPLDAGRECARLAPDPLGRVHWPKARGEAMEQGGQREAVQVQHPSVFAFGLPVSRAARRTPEGAQGR